jgi:hypothetical protein
VRAYKTIEAGREAEQDVKIAAFANQKEKTLVSSSFVRI